MRPRPAKDSDVRPEDPQQVYGVRVGGGATRSFGAAAGAAGRIPTAPAARAGDSTALPRRQECCGRPRLRPTLLLAQHYTRRLGAQGLLVYF